MKEEISVIYKVLLKYCRPRGDIHALTAELVPYGRLPLAERVIRFIERYRIR